MTSISKYNTPINRTYINILTPIQVPVPVPVPRQVVQVSRPIYTDEIYFKLAWSTRSKNYKVHKNWTLQKLVDEVTGQIVRDFGIEEGQFELVETGQMIGMGEFSENAPALILTESDETLESRYGVNIRVAFYIRRLGNMVAGVVPVVAVVPIGCQLCLETNRLVTAYFGCSHTFCTNCRDGCLDNGHLRCPCCRHAL
jgi:hypothetical protein